MRQLELASRTYVVNGHVGRVMRHITARLAQQPKLWSCGEGLAGSEIGLKDWEPCKNWRLFISTVATQAKITYMAHRMSGFTLAFTVAFSSILKLWGLL